MPLKLIYKIDEKDNNKSLGDFLRQYLSKKAIIALKHRGGKICVNHQEKATTFILNTHDIVTITFPEEPISKTLSPLTMPINIVYEDDYILVVDKLAGIPVAPVGRHNISLANGILAHYELTGLKSTVHFVNRLDKDTSGLLVVAKYRHIHYLMTNVKPVTRKYYAKVAGIIKDSGWIDARIFKPSARSVKRLVHPSGQPAITHYEVVQHFANSTLVICTLETGRTHQIRVHMAHIGHPILKDPLYGDGKEADMQLLHSYFLEFIHPITGKILCFERSLPNRFL